MLLLLMGVLGLAEPLAAQQTPPLLDPGRIKTTGTAERSQLDRTRGLLTSTVEVTLRNEGTQRLDGPLHAILRFKNVEGEFVTNGVAVSDAQGGFGLPPWQTPFFDLTPQVPAGGLLPGNELAFTLVFTRDRSLKVTYHVEVAGLMNHDPSVDPGGPYSGAVGEPVSFNAAATDPDGHPLSFTWDFGDGARAQSAVAEHAFGTPGVHHLELTVADDHGAVVVREVVVTVVPAGDFALARTRAVDGNGHPLGGTSIEESGPGGTRTLTTQDSGFISLGTVPGDYLWKFSVPGHLAVWRRAALAARVVRTLPSPWLAEQGRAGVPVSVLEANIIASADGSVRLTFPPGALDQSGEARLTLLGGQTLPLPLPFGWSPLAAFHLDLPGPPSAPGQAEVRLAEAAAVGEFVNWVEFDATQHLWRVIAAVAGNGTDQIAAEVARAGTFAAVVRDEGTGAPLPVAVGEALPAGAPQNLVATVAATGAVDPRESTASPDGSKVTARGIVHFTAGATLQKFQQRRISTRADGDPADSTLPSGSWFRLAMQETYNLSDGSAFRTPDYDATFYAYRRPAPNAGAHLRADFPLRPRLLFAAAELKEARLHADVLSPLGTDAGALSPAGGLLEDDDLHVEVPPNALGGFGAGELRALNPAGFGGLVGAGQVVVRAFELNLSGLEPGALLAFGLNVRIDPNADFVLARLIRFASSSGLEPVQRFRSDPAGVLTSAEPNIASKLPGLTGAGQYLLVQLAAPQGLVAGLTRAGSLGGAPLANIGVRSGGQPWLSVSNSDGSFSLLLPAGPGSLLASQSASGDGGFAAITMPPALTSISQDVAITAIGPRVASTSPAADATNVPVVTPIAVTFSERIAPASLGTDGLTLRAAGAPSDVPATLTLDLSNRLATLLPTNPLAPDTTYTLTVSAPIRDLQNLALEGPREFRFTTAAPAARGEGAQLTIFEPDATNLPAGLVIPGYNPAQKLSRVVAIGNPGTADPEVPVLLVNETTGETATVLSKPDGSFANFIQAAEDERVSAIFVNANGTRVTVPATRQLFDDGRVGLFNTGGILEAQGDGGPVQVIVAPGAIPERSVFRVSALDAATLLALLNGVEPEGNGVVISGVHLDITGDPLSESVDVSVPIDLATLPIPPGGDPADATFALTRAIEVDGQKVFEIVDKMEFAGGKLTTASPPFLGPSTAGDYLTTFMAYTVNGGRSVTSGRVVAVAGGSGGNGSEVRVPGAVVYVDSLAADGTAAGTPAALGNGRYVSVADDEGKFRLLTPLPSAFAGAIRLGAVSNRFPGLLGTGVAQVIAGGGLFGGLIATPGVVFFNSSTPVVVLSGLDVSSPSITFAEPSRGLAITGQAIPLRFLATDNSTTPTLNVVLLSFDPIPGDPPIQPAQFAFNAGTPASSGLNTRRDATLTTQRQGKVTLRATATDGAGNSPTVNDYVFFIRDNQVLLDFSDSRGPYVLSSAPQDGAQGANRFLPIQVFFNEPIDASFPADFISGFRVTPSAGQPYVSFSEDQRAFSIYFPDLQGDTLYSLDLQPSFLRDIAGNPLDQDTIPDGFLTHYTAVFRTAREGSASVQVHSGGGVVENNGYFYFIDRGLGGLLKVFRKTPQDPIAHLVTTEPLLDYPRDILFIDDYSYRVPVNGGPPEVRLNRDLLVITGGLVGGASEEGFQDLGPWLQVFDVTNPDTPVGVVLRIISDSPSASFVKLDWSPPILSVLELNGSETAIHYIDLALFLWANHRSHNPVGDPPNGFHGVDINGDGDYADIGELFPAPKSGEPAVGLINAGLTATFLPTPGAGRFTDFDMQFGGRFLGVTGSGISGGSGYYQTLVDGGVLFTAASAFNAIEPIAGLSKRVLTLFGVPLAAPTGGARLANLALVSEGTRLVVIDITAVLNPTLLTTIDLAQVSGGGLGLAQSAILRTDGLVALSCSSGQLILDPKRFSLPAQTGAPLPSVLGVRPGIGAGTRAFVSRDDLFAINQGTKALLSADAVDDIPLLVTGIFAEDINDPPPLPSFPPPGFVNPPPVIRQSKPATAPDAAAPNQLLEITDSVLPGQDPVLRLTALIQPAAASFQPSFPEWKLNGLTVARGPRVEVAIPGYSNPGGAIFPSLVGILGPQVHTIICENKTLIVRVYPDIKAEDKINLSALTQKLNAASEAIEDVVEAVAPPGLVSGEFKVEFPLTATFAFVNQWKECDALTDPLLHKANWSFEAEAGFDPLIGLSGKLSLGPQIPFIQATVFIEAYGQLTLKGKLSRDQCANLSGCILLTGKFGLKAGVELDLAIVEVVVEADAPISITAQVCATSIVPLKVTSKFGATFDGLAGKVTVKAIGGIFEFTNEVQLIGSTTLIPEIETILLP